MDTVVFKGQTACFTHLTQASPLGSLLPLGQNRASELTGGEAGGDGLSEQLSYPCLQKENRRRQTRLQSLGNPPSEKGE